MSNNKPPVLKLHAGALKLAIWENSHESKKYHSATLCRSYKDEKSGEWKDTQQFSTRDLPALAQLLLTAYQIIEVKEQGSKSDAPAPTSDERAPF